MTLLHIYFIFLIIGAFGLLSSLIFGLDDLGDLADGLDAGDSMDGSPSVLSFRVIFSFLLAFAIGGGGVYYSGGPVVKQIIFGLAAGVLAGAFVWWIMSILYKMQGADNVNSDDFIGKSGDIVIGTTENTRKSKVRVSTISGPMEMICKEANDENLKSGDLVKITGKIGTLLIVTKNK